MKVAFSSKRSAGLTSGDVLAISAVVLLLLLLLLMPSGFWGKSKASASLITCVSKLKQIALAERMWANDHGDRKQFIAALPHQDGGMKEVVTGEQNLAEFYRGLSNELYNPKVLACPGDRKATPAERFDKLRAENISYFLNIDAAPTQTNVALHGDSRLSIRKDRLVKLVTVTNGLNISWDGRLHAGARSGQGNIAFTDGHVSILSDENLRRHDVFVPEGAPPVRLLFP